MLTLRLTQKLAARLQVQLAREPAPAANPCADWCCHGFTVDRYRYLMVTNAPTFFSVVLRSQGMSDEPAFITGMLSGLREYLQQAGHEFAFAQLIAPESAAVLFRPVSDRRILGVMNEFIFIVTGRDVGPAQRLSRRSAWREVSARHVSAGRSKRSIMSCSCRRIPPNSGRSSGVSAPVLRAIGSG
jgi:hypothetical protein